MDIIRIIVKRPDGSFEDIVEFKAIKTGNVFEFYDKATRATYTSFVRWYVSNGLNVHTECAVR